MKVKLTAPQQRLLEEIYVEPRHACVYYPPAKGLIKRGFAAYDPKGGKYSRLTITPAGIAYHRATHTTVWSQV